MTWTKLQRQAEQVFTVSCTSVANAIPCKQNVTRQPLACRWAFWSHPLETMCSTSPATSTPQQVVSYVTYASSARRHMDRHLCMHHNQGCTCCKNTHTIAHTTHIWHTGSTIWTNLWFLPVFVDCMQYLHIANVYLHYHLYHHHHIPYNVSFK